MFKSKNATVSAVLWDFDGTIANTMAKNYSIIKKIYPIINPNIKKENWPNALTSLNAYIKAEYESINWIDCFENQVGFTKNQIELVKSLWDNIASKDKTNIKIFNGLSDIFNNLKIPHGICSQNSSKNILNVLKKHEIDHHFISIIGNKEIQNQKPHPESFLLSIKNMKIKEGLIFYIGDHEEDVMFAKNAEIALDKMGYNFKILSIGACYSGSNTKLWKIQPDYIATNSEEILKIIYNDK